MEEEKRTQSIDDDFVIEPNNDASASAFGWAFQASSALFLFVSDFDEADSVKVETKRQDIEIKLEDKSIIFAQAKSSQSYSGGQNENSKLKNAILSLAKTGISSKDHLLYISNLRYPLDKDDKFFNGVIREYSEFDQEKRDALDLRLKETAEAIKDEISKEESASKKKTLALILNRLASFPKNQFEVCTLYPCSEGYQSSLDNPIMKVIADFLYNKAGIDAISSTSFSRRVFDFWNNHLNVDQTLKDNGKNTKGVNKQGFAWSIVALCLLTDNIDRLSSEGYFGFAITPLLKSQAHDYLEGADEIVHQNWEHTYKMLLSFSDFCNENPKSTNVAKDFILKSWNDYSSYFPGGNLHLNEILTKNFMFGAIEREDKFNKISGIKGVLGNDH